MRRARAVDWKLYVLAIPLLARNPALLLAPFAGALVGVFLTAFYGGVAAADPLSGMVSGGIAQLIAFLLKSFALGVSLIIASGAWRRGVYSFDDAWVDARRKAGDILMAALGLNLVVYVAGLVGAFVSPPAGMLLSLAAIYFLIYTLPAAAIGGFPGTAALQASIDRVQRRYVPTAVLLIVSGAAYLGLGFYLPLTFVAPSGVIGEIVSAHHLVALAAQAVEVQHHVERLQQPFAQLRAGAERRDRLVV